MDKYIDNVVLKLRREYSKDELVSHLSKKLTESEIERGKLCSYVSELLYEKQNDIYKIQLDKQIKKTELLQRKINNMNIDLRKNEIIESQKKEISLLKSEVKRLRKNNNNLIYENIKKNT